MKTAVAGDDFYEDDEPAEAVFVVFDAGPHSYTMHPVLGQVLITFPSMSTGTTATFFPAATTWAHPA